MNCPTCRASMNPVYNMDHFHCASCNTFEFPVDSRGASDTITSTGRVTDFFCPCCPDTHLEVGKLQGAEVCYCNHCRGYAIDTDTFGALIVNLRSSYTGSDDQPVLMNHEELQVITKCPACLGEMQTHPYYGPGNVVLDSCMNCKLCWIGHGELDKIVRAPGVRNTRTC